ncbi:MAG: NAD(P)/FAD-dependent oxidoreductase [Coriobacteriia bacterium]|nr:NAD(P)/FAD-dependent oxidoreductase [Coriobacteriia bacterium]
MKRDYPNLCKPLRVGPYTLRNRMCSAPLGATDVLADGTPGPRTQGWYEQRAKGGAAIVTVSELVVHPETDGSQMLRLSLKTPGQLGAFTYVADAIKRHGALASIELSHSGQYAGTYMVDKKAKSELCQYGPSDGVRPDGMKVKALTKEQIDDIVASYAEAAQLAQRAGFQMCMVHCGHGWLINQFLSPWFNKRTDEYGGSFENRLRFAREVLTAIRQACGPRFPIEMRMSGAELFDGGYTLEDGVQIATALEDLVDIIHVSAGSYQFGFSTTHPSMFRDHGCNVYLAEEIKKHVSKPVATLGGLSDPAQMEQIVAEGKADICVMGRALIADPELPNKVMSNRGDEVVRCMRCFVCMAERPVTQTRRCALNPRIGREIEGLEVVPVPEHRRKKVLVAGGGIAGMVAAVTARERGHEVILCEAEGELGGILRTEKALPFKQDMYQLGVTYATLCRKAGVDVRLNTTVDAALADEIAADAVIVAVGSESMTLPVPVSDDANVLSIDDMYLDGKEPGDEVVIVGGGLTGTECALLMDSKGKKVHLVEMRDGLAIDANIRHRPILLAEVDKTGIDVVVNARAMEVSAQGVTVQMPDGETKLIPGDTVVCAIGQRSRHAAVDELRDAAPFVRIIGDAAQPRNITMAVYEAYHAALDV